jgi:hypothetical protein
MLDGPESVYTAKSASGGLHHGLLWRIFNGFDGVALVL